MTTSIATVARAAHALAAAVNAGGALFGRIVLEPSVEEISNREERGRVVNGAWRRFGGVQLGAVAIMAATWYGRRALSGRRWGSSSRSRRAASLARVHDVLVGATVVSAVGAAVAGSLLAKQRPRGAVPMNGEGEAASEAPARARVLHGITDACGLVNLVAGVAVVATSALE